MGIMATFLLMSTLLYSPAWSEELEWKWDSNVIYTEVNESEEVKMCDHGQTLCFRSTFGMLLFYNYINKSASSFLGEKHIKELNKM